MSPVRRSHRTPHRIVAHVDMDAFFASIEARDHPAYRGVPLIVGASPTGRGVVAAASYEARRFGIRSAMPSREAYARCPHALFIPPRMDRYQEVSEELGALLEEFTPVIEPLSIDEAFLDLTGCPVASVPPAEPSRGVREVRPASSSQAVASVPPADSATGARETRRTTPSQAVPAAERAREGGSAEAVGARDAAGAGDASPGGAGDPGLIFGRAIQERIHAALRLPASVGVAPNKFLAKLASELAKPDGVRRIHVGEVESVLDPLPVTLLWGVGEETRARLGELGIATIGALRRTPASTLRASLGGVAEHLAQLSRGIDDRAVEPGREAKSVGRETTFERDVRDAEVVGSTLLALAEDVARRLRAARRVARTVTLKVRYGDFHTITREASLPVPTDTGADLYRTALGLWERSASRGRLIRLLGISASRLGGVATGGGAQQDLFGETARRGRVDRLVDAINERFGEGTVRPARGTPAEEPRRGGPR